MFQIKFEIFTRLYSDVIRFFTRRWFVKLNFYFSNGIISFLMQIDVSFSVFYKKKKILNYISRKQFLAINDLIIPFSFYKEFVIYLCIKKKWWFPIRLIFIFVFTYSLRRKIISWSNLPFEIAFRSFHFSFYSKFFRKEKKKRTIYRNAWKNIKSDKINTPFSFLNISKHGTQSSIKRHVCPVPRPNDLIRSW